MEQKKSIRMRTYKLGIACKTRGVWDWSPEYQSFEEFNRVCGAWLDKHPHDTVLINVGYRYVPIDD